MGINKKGKRKICVENKVYIWYVNEDHDSPYYTLNIFSEDKSLIVSCPLKTETAYLISKGSAFQNQKTSGVWNRYLLPFLVPDIITPVFVAEIISWSTSGANATLVEWNGRDIPV